MKKILFTTISLIALTGYNSQAQWAGSPINTHTNSNVGIGLTPGPADDANLQIDNKIYPSHLPSPISMFTNLPAQKIQRKCYTNMTLAVPPSRIFEIWRQNFDELTLMPFGNNNLSFFVDNEGSVGINKTMAGRTLDVGGNANIDDDLTVGTDISAGNDVNVGNRLNVTSDAAIGGQLNVTTDATIGGQLNVGGASTLNSTLTLSPLASGSNKLPILDNSGTVTSQNLPTLGISGSNITLSNGGSISSTITLPAAPAGDHLGNHKATMNLNMDSKNITSVNKITSTYMDVNDLDFRYFGLSAGSLKAANSAAGNFLSLTGILAVNTAPASGYDITTHNKIMINGLSVGSDKRLKDNIVPIKGIKEKVLSINAYSYNYNQDAVNLFNYDNKIKHIGFLAQEIQSVFPSITPVFDNNGHLAVNYLEVIPLLLETLKEEDAIVQNQGEQIELLKKEIELLKNKSTNSNTSLNDNKQSNVTTISSRLNQNVPNPFGKETIIGFSIVGEYDQAFIGIYNLNGQELRKINIQKGQSEITLNADQLEAGMYVYSLIVNNNLIDSKKMVISK